MNNQYERAIMPKYDTRKPKKKEKGKENAGKTKKRR
jgi:hypothetical protein